MSIGGRRDPGQIGRAEWQRLATTLGVGPRLVFEEVERQAARMPTAFAEVAAAHQDQHSDTPLIQRLRSTIARQCRCTLGLLRR